MTSEREIFFVPVQEIDDDAKQALKARELELHNAYMACKPGSREESDLELELEKLTLQLYVLLWEEQAEFGDGSSPITPEEMLT